MWDYERAIIQWKFIEGGREGGGGCARIQGNVYFSAIRVLLHIKSDDEILHSMHLVDA